MQKGPIRAERLGFREKGFLGCQKQANLISVVLLKSKEEEEERDMRVGKRGDLGVNSDLHPDLVVCSSEDPITTGQREAQQLVARAFA